MMAALPDPTLASYDLAPPVELFTSPRMMVLVRTPLAASVALYPRMID